MNILGEREGITHSNQSVTSQNINLFIELCLCFLVYMTIKNVYVLQVLLSSLILNEVYFLGQIN